MVLSSFLITSRETLEAALVVGIVLAYLIKTNNERYKKTVYYGIVAGIVFSILAAVLFTKLAGGFEGKAEEVFEGITMLFAAFLLTTMIFWMLKQRNIAGKIESKVADHIEKANINKRYAYGLFILVAVAVLREGVETVIFLNALSFASGISFVGGLLGVVTAIFIGYLFFVSALKINLKKFFNISSIFLILIAAGLVAQGTHELQEAGVLSYGTKEVWNINPKATSDNNFPLMHEKGIIGSFLKGLFGYNGNPSLLEVLFYVSYLVGIFLVYKIYFTAK
ncbi:FTR1 family protein [Candidatus Woesearchaeota archaeon]|nr:FTR1 family protein [Candidatus Woesearchaeota archaeon]